MYQPPPGALFVFNGKIETVHVQYAHKYQEDAGDWLRHATTDCNERRETMRRNSGSVVHRRRCRTYDGTPVTEAYKDGNNKFTGKIHKVTIDLTEMKEADRQEKEKARVDVARKKALVD